MVVLRPLVIVGKNGGGSRRKKERRGDGAFWGMGGDGLE